MSLQEFKSILQSCGIVGAGGAGFPSYAKLAEGADTLVLNCAECEPLLYTDYMLMRESMPFIVRGAQHVMDATGIGITYLAIKRHRADMLGLSHDEQLAERVIVKCLPDVYPMGDEIQLIFEATGRLIPPGSLPIAKGVIVLNAETACNICKAVEKGAPVTDISDVRPESANAVTPPSLDLRRQKIDCPDRRTSSKETSPSDVLTAVSHSPPSSSLDAKRATVPSETPPTFSLGRCATSSANRR